jgi:hypothetical protein
VSNYNGFNAKMHTWAPGKDDVEVKLLELANKGHWICKETQVYTGKEMWNFCKKYSLNKTNPSVSITSPKSPLTYTCFAPVDQAEFPSIDITADASDPNGTIAKVEFYDGNTLIATCEKKPYKATFENKKSGTHTIKVVATDNDGEKSTATIEVTLQAASTSLTISSDFKEGNALPAGWTTYDSSERRTGYSSGYSSGCRVLQFTGSTKGFSYGLYFRNINGKAHQGYAKYGLGTGGTILSMAPGHYTLKYKICNWNMADFGQVEVGIEKRSGNTSIASQTYLPNINIGNVASNSFSSPVQQSFEFDIAEQGDYAIAIYSAASEWSDCIVGQLILTNNSYVATEIESPMMKGKYGEGYYFDLQGRRVNTPTKPGLYIKDGKKVVIR